MSSQTLPDLGPLYARQDESDRVWRDDHRIVDPSIAWDVLSAERAHFHAQDPASFDASNRPATGTIVLDRDGDGWEFKRTRWTQISGNEQKMLRVTGIQLWADHAPYRVIGRSFPGNRPTEWAYRTIRPRKPRR